MSSPGSPSHHGRRVPDAGVWFHAFRRTVTTGLAVVLLAALAGCRSGGDTVPQPDPYRSGVSHYDIAFSLVHDAPAEDLVHVYTVASIGFSEAGRIDRAEQALSVLDLHVRSRGDTTDRNGSETSRSIPPGIEILLDQVAAWQALAARDETYVDAARDATTAALEAIGELRRDESTTRATILVRLLAQQVANPNLDEDAVRRTLDELYLVDDDTVRAIALTDAAEVIADQDDPRTLNPVVQQAIAIVPIVPSSLAAVSLNMRLAALSLVLDRPGDVQSLIDDARRRAGEGLIVETGSFDRIADMIDAAADIAGAGGGDIDPFAVIPDILTNVTPQSARARGYGYLAIARDRTLGGPAVTDAYDEAVQRIERIADGLTRGVVMSELIFRRALRDPDRDPTGPAFDLLGAIRLGAADQTVRETVLANLGGAFFLTGRGEEFDRLRGLVTGIDEYNRIALTIAEELAYRGRSGLAGEVLELMSGVPDAALDAVESPLVRLVRLRADLEEYDRAVALAEGLPDTEVARFLVTLPADFLPNPVTNGILDRISRR
ncbi:MAG: hypothetical protein ACLFR8_13050 [Alkalispirochaeta sp.]